jgi:hypothetical protein
MPAQRIGGKPDGAARTPYDDPFVQLAALAEARLPFWGTMAPSGQLAVPRAASLQFGGTTAANVVLAVLQKSGRPSSPHRATPHRDRHPAFCDRHPADIRKQFAYAGYSRLMPAATATANVTPA